jgi:hypothetical protein
VVRLEHGPDPCQLHEVVAAADRAETLDVPGGDLVVDVLGIERAVEIGETGRELLRHGPLEPDGEHRDAASDVGAHEQGVQHRRCHGGADRRTLPGVQVGHGGDVDHAVERGDLVALIDGGGLDPAAGGREDGDGRRRPGAGGRQGLRCGHEDLFQDGTTTAGSAARVGAGRG